MAAKLLLLFWQVQGILARPSFKALVESLYEKYILGYHHSQCPAAGSLVLQVRSSHLIQKQSILCNSRIFSARKIVLELLQKNTLVTAHKVGERRLSTFKVSANV